MDMASASTSRSSNLLCYFLFVILSSVVYVLAQSVNVSVQPGPPSQLREGGVVTLRCEVRDLNPVTQFLSWSAFLSRAPQVLTWEAEIYSTVDDPSYSVVNSNTDGVVVHNLVINPVGTSHSGAYKCRVMQTQTWKSVVLTEARIDISVYPAGAFPSCSPSGAAEVSEGAQMSCSVTTDVLNVRVTKASSDNEEYWNAEKLSPGIRLISSVSSTDDRVTYNCSSVPAGFPDVTLTCQIGPLSLLSVPSLTTTAESTQDISTNPPPKSPTPDAPGASPTTPGSRPTQSAGAPVSEFSPSDSPLTLTKPLDANAKPPVPDPPQAEKSPNSATESPSPKPKAPVSSRALTAFLVILVITVLVITIVAFVLERRKRKRPSETERVDYHKVQA
ncbi:transcription initiation factor TFIID subunit 12-like [Acanthaster planci]|uniref:Transcription initiation factor TFIID subunit 12-like n=1 Tax=Acanthaster planci TaxID=133434 RepID=A0A8B7YES9_ACAPL|nr:transcription initiation factor TFIID subunit 12-like [Acanthaster planci]